MDRRTLEWFELLAKALVWTAGVVLVLSVAGGIGVATSDNALPFFEEIERESRGVATVALFAGGLAASGVLAGLGAILRMLVSERLERTPPESERIGGERRERPAGRRGLAAFGARGSAGPGRLGRAGASGRRGARGAAPGPDGDGDAERGRRSRKRNDDADDPEGEDRDPPGATDDPPDGELPEAAADPSDGDDARTEDGGDDDRSDD